MAIPPTPKPQYPDVPQAPGVPPVARQFGQIQSTIVLAGADALSVLNLFSGPQWGLFTADGSPAFDSATAVPILNNLASGIGLGGPTIGDVAYRREYHISTAPQEQGAFVSYNKVQLPFDGRVTYLVSGLQSARTAFLQQLEAMAASLDLLALVMPEFQYPSCNIIHHDFRRTSRNGVTLLSVDIWVQEVRITGTASYSNTKSASGASAVNGGAVQPLSPVDNSNISSSPGQVPQTVPPAGGLT